MNHIIKFLDLGINAKKISTESKNKSVKLISKFENFHQFFFLLYKEIL